MRSSSPSGATRRPWFLRTIWGRVYALGKRKLVPGLPHGSRHSDAPSTRLSAVRPGSRCGRAAQDAGCAGTGPIVHEIAHGTDFVAATLEQATVGPIQREAFLRMHHLAERFGGPKPLGDGVRAQLNGVRSAR